MEPKVNLKQAEVIRRLRMVMMHHIGQAKAISRRDLAARIFGAQAAEKWSNTNPYDRAVRKAIEVIRDTDLICSSSKVSGYWLAASMEDIDGIANEYVARSRKMEQKARDLRRRGAERFGPQMALIN